MRPASPGIRIFTPFRSARLRISFLNQPVVCTPEQPAANGTTFSGR